MFAVPCISVSHLFSIAKRKRFGNYNFFLLQFHVGNTWRGKDPSGEMSHKQDGTQGIGEFTHMEGDLNDFRGGVV